LKWRLSLERAAAVADELKRIGYQGNPAILGLADLALHVLDPARRKSGASSWRAAST
jgi:hypothetical protein